MASDALRFPSPAAVKDKPSLRTAIPMEKLALGDAKELLALLKLRLSQAEDLLSYVDTRRGDARKAGVESIAIELSAVLEGGRLESAADALEEAIEKKTDAHLTLASLDRIRRFEKLITEASRSLGQVPLRELSGTVRAMAQAGVPAPSLVHPALIWSPIVFFGILIISVSVVAVLWKPTAK